MTVYEQYPLCGVFHMGCTSVYVCSKMQQDARTRRDVASRHIESWAYVMYHSVKCVHYHVIAMRITIYSLRYIRLLFMNRVVFIGQSN